MHIHYVHILSPCAISACCRAINDRQIDELNQRLANANHQIEAEERDDLETTDSISTLLGIHRRQHAYDLRGRDDRRAAEQQQQPQ